MNNMIEWPLLRLFISTPIRNAMKLIKLAVISTIGVILFVSLAKNDSVITDSKVRVFKDHEIIWINNERLLFSQGISICTDEKGESHSTLSFSEYEIKKNSSTSYGKFNGLFCAYNNKIIYNQMDGCSSESETYSSDFYIKDNKQKLSNSFVNEIGCTQEQLLSNAGELLDNQNNKIELAEGHSLVVSSLHEFVYNKYKMLNHAGYISSEAEHNIPVYPVEISISSDKPGISIDRQNFEPWIDEGYSVKFLKFEKFKNAYFLALVPQYNNRDTNRHYKYWWLYPDGRVEKILEFNQLDNNVFEFIDGDIIPTKNGLFIVGGSDTNALLPNHSAHHGLYSIDNNGQFKQLVNGDIKKASVSPDGCELAFYRMPQVFDPKDESGITAIYYLQTINACNL